MDDEVVFRFDRRRLWPGVVMMVFLVGVSSLLLLGDPPVVLWVLGLILVLVYACLAVFFIANLVRPFRVATINRDGVRLGGAWPASGRMLPWSSIAAACVYPRVYFG